MEDHSATGVHFLNNKMIKNHFLLCSLNNVLLDAVLRHKPVDVNLGEVSRKVSDLYYFDNLGKSSDKNLQ